MAGFKDMPPTVQMLIALGVVAGLSVAAYFGIYKAIEDDNATKAKQVAQLVEENKRLKEYEPKLADMQRQIESLKQQLENMKKIVPDEKLADQFIHLMQDTATAAGIEIRRYTARNMNSREFYSEAPYEMELDGPYYSMLNFFDKVANLERIINVGTLKVANLARGGDAGVKHRYQYAPTESVVATCVTTTFFSKDNFTKPNAPAAPANK